MFSTRGNERLVIRRSLHVEPPAASRAATLSDRLGPVGAMLSSVGIDGTAEGDERKAGEVSLHEGVVEAAVGGGELARRDECVQVDGGVE
jgi:hypothetical protein